MPLLTQGKTNLKYILIIVVLAVIVGGGILWWVAKQEPLPEITSPGGAPPTVLEDSCQDLEPGDRRNVCYDSLALETKNSEFCGKIDLSSGGPPSRAGCYNILGQLLNNPSLCEKAEAAYPVSGGTNIEAARCYRYFAVRLERADFCEKSGRDKPKCYYLLALKANNPSLCDLSEDIPGEYEEEPCKGFANRVQFSYKYQSACKLYFREENKNPSVGIEENRKFIRIIGLEPYQEITPPLQFKIWGFDFDNLWGLSLRLTVQNEGGDIFLSENLLLDRSLTYCWDYPIEYTPMTGESIPQTGEKAKIIIWLQEEKMLEVPIILGKWWKW